MMPEDPSKSADRNRSLLAIVACVILYAGYTEYLKRKYPDYMKPKEVPAETATTAEPTAATAVTASGIASPSAKSPEGSQPATKPAVAMIDPARLVFDTDEFKVQLDQNLSGIASVTLKQFNDQIGAGAKPVQLLDSPLVIQGVTSTAAPVPVQSGIFTGKVSETTASGTAITFSRIDGPWLVEQEFTRKADPYNVGVRIRFTNQSSQPQVLSGGVLVSQNIDTKVETASSFLPGSPTEKPRIVANLKDSDQFVYTETFCSDGGAKELTATNQDIRFLGFDRHYFLTAFIPETLKASMTTWVGGTAAPATNLCPVSMLLHQDFGTINAGTSVEMNLDGFLGPKVSELLKKRSLYLGDTLDRGWFDALAEPLLLAIKGFESVLHNFGLAIILLTVLLKVLFYPLTKKAAESAHKMKKFNPELQRIRERYKDDPRTQQQEVMRFMAAHKLNPMQGCFPILPQIPVFLAFYRVLSSAIELRHAPFFGWIQDLSVADPYYVTPLLLGAGMFVQQKLTPMAGVDKTQEKVMLAMPLIFTVMMLTLPAGMVLYMLANTVMSIAQQQWLNRKLTREAT